MKEEREDSEKMMGMASKIAKNGYASFKSATSVGIGSAFPKSSPNPFHQRSIPDYCTLPRWKIGGANSGKGVFRCNPVFGTRLFSNALWKGSRSNSKPPLKIRNVRSYNTPTSPAGFPGSGGKSFKWVTTDGIVIGLIATHAAVFLLWQVADTDFMVKNFMMTSDNLKSFRVHTLITSTFTHRDTIHFATNMSCLYFFGKSIGQFFGVKGLLCLYALGALSGPGLFLLHHIFTAPKLPSGRPYAEAPVQGASGVINTLVSFGISMHSLKFMPRCPIRYSLPGSTLLMGSLLLAYELSVIAEMNPEFASYGVLARMNPHFSSYGGIFSGFAPVALVALTSPFL